MMIQTTEEKLLSVSLYGKSILISRARIPTKNMCENKQTVDECFIQSPFFKEIIE